MRQIIRRNHRVVFHDWELVFCDAMQRLPRPFALLFGDNSWQVRARSRRHPASDPESR